jgi:hypothetical protein
MNDEIYAQAYAAKLAAIRVVNKPVSFINVLAGIGYRIRMWWRADAEHDRIYADVAQRWNFGNSLPNFLPSPVNK